MTVQIKSIWFEDLKLYCWVDHVSLRTNQSDSYVSSQVKLWLMTAIMIGEIRSSGQFHCQEFHTLSSKSSQKLYFCFIAPFCIINMLQLCWVLWILYTHHFLFRTRRVSEYNPFKWPHYGLGLDWVATARLKTVSCKNYFMIHTIQLSSRYLLLNPRNIQIGS